uniref:LRP chaperone MESD n=1 Tax=Poecilia latipinna TaxID=48699 RepID=A0A3B3VWF9_9TELE
MASFCKLAFVVILLCTCLLYISATDSTGKPKKKKDIRDYNDADMARLLEQWEVCELLGLHLNVSLLVMCPGLMKLPQ